MIVSDSDYLKQLEIIRKIRDTITAKDEINLPQICVIGDQSAGKSSFLSRLTGLSFPTAAKMCTKAATVVTCNRDDSLTTSKFEIEDSNNPGSYVQVESTVEAIKEAQERLLEAAGKSEENSIVTDNSIKLRVTSPNVIDIIIVDLPGIQHAGTNKDAINALIEKNIEKPETFNLLVSEAKQDAELTKAIEIAAKYDPECTRTMRVLSKFDNFDTTDTRDRAVRFVKDGYHGVSGSSHHTLNLGPHAVISVGTDGKLRMDKEGSESEKQQLVEEFDLPETRAGVMALKERLQPIFAELIKLHLPHLKEAVSTRLSETEMKLEKVGKLPLSETEIVNKCQDCLIHHVERLKSDMTSCSFASLKDRIFAVRRRITHDFATDGFEHNSFDCMLFQGGTTFDGVVRRIHEIWEPIVNDYVKSAREKALESIHMLRLDSSTKMYGSLISVIHAEHQEHLQANVLPQFQKACMRCLADESFYGTVNHYFDAKFFEDEICPTKLEKRFAQKAEQLLRDNSKAPHAPNNSKYRHVQLFHLKQCLSEAKKEISSEAVHQDLLTNQKKRIYAAVKAHFEVEKKTLVDNLLKKTKDVLIKGYTNWIKHELLRSDKIRRAAGENESTKRLRETLIAQLARLEESMDLLRDVPFPVESSHEDANSDMLSDSED